jgi:uncharacterized protein YjbI with pentapeptide repeats
MEGKTMLRKVTKKELEEILAQHKLWLDTNMQKGKCADLSNTNLDKVDLSNVNLQRANLDGASLKQAILKDTNLHSACLWDSMLNEAQIIHSDLSSTDMFHAHLEEAYIDNSNLWNANIQNASLDGATIVNSTMKETKLNFASLERATIRGTLLHKSTLADAYLCNAILDDVILTNSDLSFANLEGADLSNVRLAYSNLTCTHFSEKEECRKGITLKEDMIGYKKCRGNRIVKLCIPKGSIVFSINNYKCRTNKAKVLEITSRSGKITYQDAESLADSDFKYKVGKTIRIKDFDLMYNVECASGIHFFKTREEAIDYKL